MSINDRKNMFSMGETNSQDQTFPSYNQNNPSRSNQNDQEYVDGQQFNNDEETCWSKLSPMNKIIYITTSGCCAFVVILLIYSIFIKG